MLPKHIFLSYASQDLERAKALVSVLEHAGWSVWWDRHNLRPGERYRHVIEEAITMARCVVVLWSVESVKSEWVEDEAQAGNKRGVLVPVLLDRVEPPLGFRNLQSARLGDWSGERDHPELVRLLATIGAQAGQPSQHSLALADAYFDIQSDIIQEHAQRFVGRSRVQQALEQFMKQQQHGYFTICGAPGLGKTALAAHLVARHGFIHHFVSRDGRRADSSSVIRSLLAQLPYVDESVPDGAVRLTTLLSERLAHHAALNGRAVVLVDALDELRTPGEGSIDWLLFDPLPKGVFVIFTAPPGGALEELRERVFAVPHVWYELEPLDASESATLLRAWGAKISDSDVQRLVLAAEGNPLLLQAALTEPSEVGDPEQFPAAIEDCFRRATKRMNIDPSGLLGRVLGILGASRRMLSLTEISQITGINQRRVDAEAIQPIRPYLFELRGTYGFFHRLFGEYVRRSLLYEDEMAEAHRAIVAWLTKPDCAARDYRTSSLAYHLYHARDHVGLATHIDEEFLGRKARELGYGVLEDIELLSLSHLDTGKPEQLQRCVRLVESLRQVVGGEVIDVTARLFRGRHGFESIHAVSAHTTPAFPGVTSYVGMRARRGVSADFADVFVSRGLLFVIIGDVPGSGLRSAFVARFLAQLSRRTIETRGERGIGKVLDDIRHVIAGQPEFDCVTMQLVELRPHEGVAEICNAGHPYPVRYSFSRKSCDRIPVAGGFLTPIVDRSRAGLRESRHLEINQGDVIVMFSDGLTEAGLSSDEPYGYRFTRVVEATAASAAKQIGEAILADWTRYPRQSDDLDDLTLMVLKVDATSA